MFKDKNIIIGITGGIAAYKACGLISYLKGNGANVFVIMSEHATNFITPLTIESLSGNDCIVDMFDRPSHKEVLHIDLAKKADLFIIVPASANIIGKVANGICDDMLTTTIIATKALVIFAPAMNNQMYENAIVQDNIKKLKSYGYKFIEPCVGHLACGGENIGKLPETKILVKKIKEIIEGKLNEYRKI